MNDIILNIVDVNTKLEPDAVRSTSVLLVFPSFFFVSSVVAF